MKKALFIDKDGTLIKNVPYNIDPDAIELESGVGESLSYLSTLDYRFFVISNQSGIARGLFTEDKLNVVSEKIQTLLEQYSVKINGFYYCPHLPNGIVKGYAKKCYCRKPSPGLILKAVSEHNISLASSWIIGDILTDIETGNRVGCKTILINNGNETEWKFSSNNIPHYIVPSFEQIKDVISLPAIHARNSEVL